MIEGIEIDTNAWAVGLVVNWVKAGALLGLTWIIVKFRLRRSSASARHAAWLTGILAALTLPLAGSFLPGWRVIPAADVKAQPIADATALAFREVPHPAVEPAGSGVSLLAEVAAPPSLPSWQAVLVAIWLGGVMLLLGRVVFAWIRLAQMTRRSKPFQSPATEAEVRISGEIAIPLVWGWRRPVILLPRGAETWPDERVRAVLLHELAHVRRRDPLTQLGLELARAALWTQPLIWLAIRELKRERETACDDAVLAAGITPPSYARSLVEVVSASSGLTPAGALAMANRGSLEARVRGVLDGSRPRNRASSCWWLAASALAAAITIPLAMLTAEAQEKSDPDTTAKTGPWSVAGNVTDADGQPMEGVDLSVFTGHGTLRRAGKTTSGADGRFALNFGSGFQAEGDLTQAATIYAAKAGFFEANLSRAGDCVAAMRVPEGFPLENNPRRATRERLIIAGEVKELNFQMLPAGSLEGRLVDAQGPVAKRKIRLTGPDLPPSSSVLARIETDEEGRFKIADLPTKFGFNLQIQDAAKGQTGWSLGPMFFKAETGSPVAFGLAENDAPMLAEELEIELGGPAHPDYEKRNSTRSVQAQGGATINLSGGGGIRVGGGGGEGLRIQGQGAMRSKRLKITLGGPGGGAINLQP